MPWLNLLRNLKQRINLTSVLCFYLILRYRPARVFWPIGWSYFTLSLGYASYIFRKNPQTPSYTLPLYVAHVLLLLLWPLAMFVNHSMSGSLFVMILTTITNVGLIASARKISLVVTAISAVYQCWLVLMTYLNWYMWRWNWTQGETTKEEVKKRHEQGRIKSQWSLFDSYWRHRSFSCTWARVWLCILSILLRSCLRDGLLVIGENYLATIWGLLRMYCLIVSAHLMLKAEKVVGLIDMWWRTLDAESSACAKWLG